MSSAMDAGPVGYDAELRRHNEVLRLDVAISRFGTMFFDDPGAAFGNIGRALRPAAHLSQDGVWLDSRAWIVTARRR